MDCRLLGNCLGKPFALPNCWQLLQKQRDCATRVASLLLRTLRSERELFRPANKHKDLPNWTPGESESLCEQSTKKGIKSYAFLMWTALPFWHVA